ELPGEAEQDDGGALEVEPALGERDRPHELSELAATEPGVRELTRLVDADLAEVLDVEVEELLEVLRHGPIEEIPVHPLRDEAHGLDARHHHGVVLRHEAAEDGHHPVDERPVRRRGGAEVEHDDTDLTVRAALREEVPRVWISVEEAIDEEVL